MSTDSPKPASFGSFTISRQLNASPARVYAAWSTKAGKDRWFKAINNAWELTERHFDFRVGGHDIMAGKWQTGMVSRFAATYLDIVPDQRIVYAYDLLLDDKKISVSLATIEFHAEVDGTRMTVTEQGAFLDGYEDNGSRETGTKALMDMLVASLEE